MTESTTAVGFGDQHAQFAVYLPHPPAMAAYQQLSTMRPLLAGDIDNIYRHCGNGWRKIFNVYAKLVAALPSAVFNLRSPDHSWQQYRDTQLLQAHSGTALCFSAPLLPAPAGCLQLIAGRTHAKHLLAQGMPADFYWLNHEFAVDVAQQLLVTPFFDYRQLNNEKIQQTALLLALMQQNADLATLALVLAEKHRL
jgi:hypothetical protein